MSLFSFIKQHISILDVINEYVRLKKAGLYHKGCCPFHTEKTASFTVSPHKEIFYCFGCHAGGDVITFISRIEQCSQLDAAKLLIERYQLTPPEQWLTAEPQTYDKKKKYYTLNHLVAQWCHELLLKSPAILRYMHDRGIDKTCLELFAIGYFPSGTAAIQSLINYVSKQQFLAHDLLEAHIIRSNKATFYSPFEERIMFPIIDHAGNYCGFGGRIYTKNDTRAKYYNSQENDFFNKGSLLYGLNIAKETIQKRNAAFLVEGYTDCIAMIQHGYKNTIASLGTACTLEQLKLISRYAEQVYVLYDNDTAGQQAILRLAQCCWQFNLDLKIIQLPGAKDPAAYLKHELNIDKQIKEAQNIFSFFVNSVSKDFTQQSLQQKMQVVHKILQLISHVSDSVKQDILLQEASQTLDISYDTLKKNLSQANITPKKPEPISSLQPEVKVVTQSLQEPTLEKNILCAILNDVSLLHKHSCTIAQLLSENYKLIIKKIEIVQEEKKHFTVPDLFDLLSPEEKQLVSQALFSSETPDTKEDFECLLLQLQKKHWKSMVHDIKKKLQEAKNNNDTQQIINLMQQFTQLKKIMLENNN